MEFFGVSSKKLDKISLPFLLGRLNYDELVVYDDDAIIPAYLIIYQECNPKNSSQV